MISTAAIVLLNVACLRALSFGQECINSNGAEYRGEQQITSTGEKCLNWRKVSRDSNITENPDHETGISDHSYCRNPDRSSRPWCYVAGRNNSIQRQDCAIDICQDKNPTQEVTTHFEETTLSDTQVFEPAQSGSSQSESAAVQPVIGISQRVRTGPKQKKDLGTLGFVLGIIMMVLIIMLGVGITLGYIYKRGRDLKKQHDQRVYEREMQRITLPLSAFTNPTCEILDENAVVIGSAHQTPVEEAIEGKDPLMGQAVTPGA
ncbi:phosphoinositide-3-kinase-interacting protein 1 isoform X2 [Erpetoichthys calabaricus]|uniref:Phosphoinositide-3-kinase interacting protein 1 n=1 Tax=Erpetoichthys calabaricus TaxID=27687 RepID=A0A8C4SYA8_ERPCA|nr:phosphoinositide-3-kinase-interacting protein 1 isoform X2 [Erpetoichthys calabaricus]